MPIDRSVFIDNFIEELRENTRAIDTQILILKKDQENEEALTTLLRALHTIKGSARMLKFSTVESLAHGLETVFKGVREKRFAVTKPLIQLVFLTTDSFGRCVRSIRERKTDEIDVRRLLVVFEKANANEPYSLDELAAENKERDAAADAARSAANKAGGTAASNAGAAATGGASSGLTILPADGDAGVEAKTAYEASRGIRLMEEPAEGAAGKTGAANEPGETETIRIKIDKVDAIIKLLNNLIIKQFQFKKRNETFVRMEERLRDYFQMKAEGKEQAAGVIQKRENELLRLLQELAKGFSEDIGMLERNTFEVQEEILSLRMLPMAMILDSMGKMVEETAMALGKEIEFRTAGTDVLLDKMILERLHDPLIHLVRNAIDHGVETPAEREANGKTRTGSLEILCSSEGGNITIRIRDDGQGIDYEAIRRKAIEANPMMDEEIRKMDRTGLNAFLFLSGFSTKDQVSNLSGRGVGLDIVKHNIDKIKGKITIQSEWRKGTEFILTLPLSLATVDGFFVQSSGEKFLIPSNFVKEVIIIRESEKFDLLHRQAIRLRDSIIPLHALSAVLNRPVAEGTEKLYVLVVESLGEIVGIVVDMVVQFASLIYKPLPRNLSALKVLQGIVFDENFNIITILNIPEIMNRFKSVRNIDSRKRFSAGSRENRHILVVDDSYTTREIEKSILEVENYQVDTAVDGIDGLEKLKEKDYHLIVTDINMPRMDGLTFVENLRRDERYRGVPVIVVSSVEDPEIWRRFLEVGATSRIIKSDFDRGHLLTEVRTLIG